MIELGDSGVSSLLFTLPDPAGDVTLVATHLSWPFGAHLAGIRNAQTRGTGTSGPRATGPIRDRRRSQRYAVFAAFCSSS